MKSSNESRALHVLVLPSLSKMYQQNITPLFSIRASALGTDFPRGSHIGLPRALHTAGYCRISCFVHHAAISPRRGVAVFGMEVARAYSAAKLMSAAHACRVCASKMMCSLHLAEVMVLVDVGSVLLGSSGGV